MCKNCELNPVYEFTNQRKLCKNCFIKWFQKKVFYSVRKFEMIKSEDAVGYFARNNFRSVVLEDVLKMFEKRNTKIVKLPSKKKVGKIAISLTTDLIAYEIIDKIIHGNVKNLKNIFPADKKTIEPIYLFLDKEILLYAKLRKLKFKEVNEKKSEISKFIDELEEKHPEVKQSIVSGWLKIYCY